MLAGIEGEATRPRLQLRSRRLPPARRISDATPETLTATPTDTNDVRKATDAGEHPLMDSYIPQEVHQNRFASRGTVD